MSSHWSLNHRPTGSRVELAKHSHSTSWVWSWAGKLRNHLKDGHSAREDFYVGWKLSPRPLLRLLSLNKGKEAQQERAHLALTSSLRSGSPMLLATGKWSLQGCCGELQGSTGKSEVPEVGSVFMLAPFFLSFCPLACLMYFSGTANEMALHGKGPTCRWSKG